MQPFDPQREYLALRRRSSAHLAMRGMTLLAWCLWLLGSWMVARRMEYPSTAMAVRLMMLAVMVGLVVLWPALRLSQDRWVPFFMAGGRAAAGGGPAGGRTHAARRGGDPWSVLSDWVGLAAVTQAVIWPFTFTAGWTLTQTLWMDAAVLSWGFLAAAMVAWGVRSSAAWARTTMMAACILFFLGEPAAMSVTQMIAGPDPALAWTMRISPLATIWHLAEPGGLWSAQPFSEHILIVAIASIIAWILVIAMHTISARQAKRDAGGDGGGDGAP
jgi:hypothetical protein